NIGVGADYEKDSDAKAFGNGAGITFARIDQKAGIVLVKNNKIKNNSAGNGVDLTAVGGVPRGVTIVDPNLIYNNGGLGIDLGPSGPTTLQMPVLTSASVSSGVTTISCGRCVNHVSLSREIRRGIRIPALRDGMASPARRARNITQGSAHASHSRSARGA